jgi:hypothetical protein
MRRRTAAAAAAAVAASSSAGGSGRGPGQACCMSRPQAHKGDAGSELGGAELFEPRAATGARDDLVGDQVGHDLVEVVIVGQRGPHALQHVLAVRDDVDAGKDAPCISRRALDAHDRCARHEAHVLHQHCWGRLVVPPNALAEQ